MEFDPIADRYDFLNHLLSLGQDFYWRAVMVKELNPLEGERILDLATGTGDSLWRMISRTSSPRIVPPGSLVSVQW